MEYKPFLEAMVASNTLGALVGAGADVKALHESGELPGALTYAHGVLAPTYSETDMGVYKALHEGFLKRGAFGDGTLEAILQNPTDEFNQKYLQTVMREAVVGVYGSGEAGLEAYLANAEAGFVNGLVNSGIEMSEQPIEGDSGKTALVVQAQGPEDAQKIMLLQANLVGKLALAQKVYGALPQRYSTMLEGPVDRAA